MKENVFKSFVRDTFVLNHSVIPYFITIQAVGFVLLCIFDLLTFSDITSLNIYSFIIEKLSLPNNFGDFISQPWSLITHILVYESLWALLFDCLWLYWVGNLFLNLLNKRQFNTVFFGGWLLGAILYVAIGSTNLTQQNTMWSSSAFGIAALISTLAILIPNTTIRLFLIGNVRFKIVAIAYLALEATYYFFMDLTALATHIVVILLGILFTYQLENGCDWSKLFARRKQMHKNTAVQDEDFIYIKYRTPVYTNNKKEKDEFPDQEQIDQILDKISLYGYESLTSQEKAILFRASKKQN